MMRPVTQSHYRDRNENREHASSSEDDLTGIMFSPCFCSMSTNLWYSKHHSISIVVEYSLTMFYQYLHSTKKSFLTFINQPCCFIRWPTFLQPRHQSKTGPQRSAPIARSWIRWGDLSSKISRDKFFGFKGCVPLTKTKTRGGSGGFFIYFASGECKVS